MTGRAGPVVVRQLWRYPVKSMGGEPLDAVDVGRYGLAGDRHWAVVDVGTGLALTARRVPELLFASARLAPDGGVAIDLPTGATVTGAAGDGDETLSAWLGRPVRLVEAQPGDRGTYEIAVDAAGAYLTAPDAEGPWSGRWQQWSGPAGVFHDSSRTRVSIIDEADLEGADVRRFRPNVLVAGTDGADALVGGLLRHETLVLNVLKRIDRCVIVTRAQPDLPRDVEVLRRIVHARDGYLAVGAHVREPGHLEVGTTLTVEPRPEAAPAEPQPPSPQPTERRGAGA